MSRHVPLVPLAQNGQLFFRIAGQIKIVIGVQLTNLNQFPPHPLESFSFRVCVVAGMLCIKSFAPIIDMDALKRAAVPAPVVAGC